jgi:sporulation related protein
MNYPYVSFKIREAPSRRWVVVREERHKSGRIIAGPFNTREEARAALVSIRKQAR